MLNILRSFLFLALVFSSELFAANVHSNMPWDGMQTLAGSMTGPVAGSISVIAIVGAGAVLIFGGQITAFLRSMVMIVLVASTMVSSVSILNMIAGSNKYASNGDLVSAAVILKVGER